jgi:hypothetical protein
MNETTRLSKPSISMLLFTNPSRQFIENSAQDAAISSFETKGPHLPLSQLDTPWHFRPVRRPFRSIFKQALQIKASFTIFSHSMGEIPL